MVPHSIIRQHSCAISYKIQIVKPVAVSGLASIPNTMNERVSVYYLNGTPASLRNTPLNMHDLMSPNTARSFVLSRNWREETAYDLSEPKRKPPQELDMGARRLWSGF